MISPKVAATALALDYVPIEQMRQMTVKAANVSLFHEKDGVPFVINLVDTPGHIDFSGHVTRSLRVMDGAVVVVDSVEGVMTQTETVVRQALEERVRPLLFINKVDRLVRELRLSPEGVQRRLVEIIRDFNGLIDLYAEPEFRRWKVDAARGQVVFGSALHRWGVSVPLGRRKGFRFDMVVEAYLKGGGWEWLAERFPLYEAILDMVIEHVPDPRTAQRYRVPKIWGGDLNSEVGRAMLECDPDGPLVFAVSKVVDDPHAGLVATGRVFSGVIEDGVEVYLLRAGRFERVQQVGMYMGPYREVVGRIPAGNIAAVLGLEYARAGETVVDRRLSGAGVEPFEALHYVSEPVVTIAIEPKRSSDLPRLIDVLRRMAIEDPTLRVTINRETGEYLLSGMGTLHLEIALWDLQQRTGGIEVEVSPPIVVYRESVRRRGERFEVKSPNKHNRFLIEVEPLDEETLRLLESGRVTEDMEWRRRARILREEAGWDADEARNIWAIDEHFNIFVDLTKGVQYLNEVKDTIINGFRWTVAAGPLAAEPMRGVKVRMLDAVIHEDPAHRGPAQLMPAIKNATMASFLTGNPVLLEPIYRIDVKVVQEFLSQVIKIITMKRGRIVSMEQKGRLAIIRGELPVAESHDLADQMRSATQGRAFWATEFSRWAPVPESLALDIIMRIRERKGLPKRLPTVEDYVK